MDVRRRHSSGVASLDPAAFLREHAVDPSLSEGARNAVVTCLGVEPGQRVVLIVEVEYEALAASLLRAAEDLGATVDVHLVDARRAAHEPFVRMLGSELRAADASLYVGGLDRLPASFRHQLIDAGGPRRRHGHMPGVTVAMMQQSMRTDYLEVRALSERLLEKLARDPVIAVRSPRGTELSIRCSPRLRWHAEDGVMRHAGWANLPAGELVTTPIHVEGVLVPDGGAWDATGAPVKHADRLRVLIDAGSVVAIEGGAGTDPQGLEAQLDAHEHGRRVGQIGLGTNVGVIAAVGNLLQDLKMPGFHLTLGHTSPERTGADWNSDVEIPLLVRRADVDVGGTPVLRGGRYVAPWL